jgi:hypothetical protein
MMTYESQFLIALITTLVVEVPLVFLLVRYFFRERKISRLRVVGIGILSTSVTIPYLWFIFAVFLDYWTMAIVGELFVFVVEALIYRKLLPISFLKAVVLSLIANVASIAVGILISSF